LIVSADEGGKLEDTGAFTGLLGAPARSRAYGKIKIQNLNRFCMKLAGVMRSEGLIVESDLHLDLHHLNIQLASL
jgi:hypothetical protein